MTTSSQCNKCVHYEGPNHCEAFPLGIPQVIFDGEHDHRKPFPGDRGIRWELLTGAEPPLDD